MDLGEQTHRVKFMIRDRGPDFTAAFDAVLADAGVRTVLCNVRTPRMNAIAEHLIGGRRRELLDAERDWASITTPAPRQLIRSTCRVPRRQPRLLSGSAVPVTGPRRAERPQGRQRPGRRALGAGHRACSAVSRHPPQGSR
jgi:hypothetical protein